MTEPREERRKGKPLRLYLVERRKGKLWKFGSIALCVGLVGYLVFALFQ